MIHDLNPFRSLVVALLLCVSRTAAHDIPNDVTAHVFVKPEGKRLQLLVRVPLRAIRDLDFPVRERGFLDTGRLPPLLPDAATIWIGDFVAMFEDGRRLARPRVVATQISLESDPSFRSFETALAHMTASRLDDHANVMWNQVLLDVLFEYPINRDRADFAIRPGLERLGQRVVTVLRFLPPGGAIRAYEFEGDPGVVPLDPRWHQAVLRFVRLGFWHILDGTDHLLFLMCLVIPFRRFLPLLGVVTAFTVAHSITLIGSAFGMAPDAGWFPPLIEVLIAVSIVFMALENIVGGVRAERRWLMAFAFGLVHGFGFSFALRETLQFAGSHLITSLLAFNAGVEAGQILVLALLIPALNACFRFVVAERTGTIILSALVAHTGWHWMTERFERLRRFRLEWPALSADSMGVVVQGLMGILIVAAVLWLVAKSGGALIRMRNRKTPG